MSAKTQHPVEVTYTATYPSAWARIWRFLRRHLTVVLLVVAIASTLPQKLIVGWYEAFAAADTAGREAMLTELAFLLLAVSVALAVFRWTLKTSGQPPSSLPDISVQYTLRSDDVGHRCS